MSYPKPSDMAMIAGATYDAAEYDAAKGFYWVAGDVHAIGRIVGDDLVVAIRGTTKNGLDILRDIRFILWWSIAGFCPAGFMKGVRCLIDETSFLLDVADYLKAGRLIIVGHSLGGALALILAAWLTAFGKNVRAVYAFEPARCGLWKMRRLWRKIGFVFVSHDGDDPVPCVPFLYFLPLVTRIGNLARVSKLKLLVSILFRFGTVVESALNRHRIAVVISDLKAAGC